LDLFYLVDVNDAGERRDIADLEEAGYVRR
jgi:hypothetical protein